MAPMINTVTKVGPGMVDPDYRITFVRCTFCEQTSLDTKPDIDHHPDCPEWSA